MAQGAAGRADPDGHIVGRPDERVEVADDDRFIALRAGTGVDRLAAMRQRCGDRVGYQGDGQRRRLRSYNQHRSAQSRSAARRDCDRLGARADANLGSKMPECRREPPTSAG